MSVTSYIFQVELAEEDDGRWSAWIETLPGCATWGYTREEALHNIHDAAEAYLHSLQKHGEPIPSDPTIQVVNAPIVAVTV